MVEFRPPKGNELPRLREYRTGRWLQARLGIVAILCAAALGLAFSARPLSAAEIVARPDLFPYTVLTSESPYGAALWAMKIADMNADGLPDVIVPGSLLRIYLAR